MQKIVEGMRFGFLTVLRSAGSRRGWWARCDCGTEKIIGRGNFRKTKSCGCKTIELQVLAKIKYKSKGGGKHPTPSYISWRAMRSRCLRVTDISYDRYGGRGISICDRWSDFEKFLSDMGDRPDGKTLNRKDNEGNYEPSNCEWSTLKEQGNNRRNNRIIEYDGDRRTISGWCDKTGISRSVLDQRLNFPKWTVEMVLTTPVRVSARRRALQSIPISLNIGAGKR